MIGRPSASRTCGGSGVGPGVSKMSCVMDAPVCALARLRVCALNAPTRPLANAATLFLRFAVDDLVDEAVLLRLVRRHEVVPVGVFLDFVERLAGVLDEQLVDLLAQPQDLAGLDRDVGRRTLHPAPRLVDHDPRGREGEALARSTGAQEERP